MNMWISKEIFELDFETQSSDITSLDKVKRAYEIWEHSRLLIETNDSEFHLSDGIANLKRALNQRLQLIEEIYNLKNIVLDGKPKGYLEILEFFGVVRPFLMKQLLEIRNDIEHRDAEPPSFEKCLELLDTVWYFLKSTDYLVLYPPTDLIHNEENVIVEDTTWIVLEYKFDIHKLFISGRLPYDDVYELPIDNSFQMECSVKDLGELDLQGSSWKSFYYFDGELKLDDDDEVTNIIKKFLSTIK